MKRRAVQGCVQVDGSSSVYSYCSISGPTRVNRSVTRTSRVEPLTPRDRLVVSTTSVSPSQCPRELPMALRGPAWFGAASPIGISRVS
ncbi:MAG: hypothetical protein IH939_18715 [Acidobacteria bacterium]|nr:hypothetical protein [Acidobacteriota bacterium]